MRKAPKVGLHRMWPFHIFSWYDAIISSNIMMRFSVLSRNFHHSSFLSSLSLFDLINMYINLACTLLFICFLNFPKYIRGGHCERMLTCTKDISFILL